MSRKRRVLFRIIRVLYRGNNHINIYMRLAGNGGKCYIGKVPLELPEAEEKDICGGDIGTGGLRLVHCRR